MRPAGTPEEFERRRWRAVELLAQGHPPGEVARMVGVDRRSVRRSRRGPLADVHPNCPCP
jgi:hypothetical protein